MKIDHLAIWCDDIERMRTFYTTYFDCSSNERYSNPAKGYSSYFLSFGGGNCRIELMHRHDICDEPSHRGFMKGIAHFCIAVSSQAEVDSLTRRLENDHYTIASGPRHTGDGYYESGILDPEGNYVEISTE